MKVCHHTLLYCFIYLGAQGQTPAFMLVRQVFYWLGHGAQPSHWLLACGNTQPLPTRDFFMLFTPTLSPMRRILGTLFTSTSQPRTFFSNGACWTLCRGQNLDALLPIVRTICSEKCWDWGHLQKPLGSIVGLRGEAVFSANNKTLFNLELKFTFSSIFAQDWE